MNRHTVARVRRWAAAGGLAIVGSFLVSSAVTELIGDIGEVRDLRLAIALALPGLIGCMAAAAITGQRLAGRSRAAIVRRKLGRMRVIAAAGAGLLVPCAIVLATRPGMVELEVAELAVGAVNFALLAMNFRDGRLLTARRRARRRAAPARVSVVHTGA